MSKSYLLIGLLLMLSSCGSSNAPATPSTDQPQHAPDSTPAANGPQSSNNTPTYPKGAQYTIFCARVDGELHVQQANKLKSDLIAGTGMKDWYVIHGDSQSMLYYGFYRTIADTNDPKEAERAQNDHKKIEMMADKMGNQPFGGAMFVELDAPDPTAPPAWNLVNANGAYSLQIAVYKDSPQRKEAAVETVQALRAQGVEAYYYHGDDASLVCVGTWPESSVRINDANSADSNTDPDQPLMVLPQMKDPELNRAFEESAQQANVKVVKPSVEIIDPTLRAMMEKYPYNAVNGMNIKRMVNGVEQYDSSLLVPIPHSKAPSVTQSEPQPQYQQPAPQQQPPPQEQQPGAGSLRSIGD